MRKVMFVSNQYPPNVVGGAELTVQTIVEELVRRGYEPSVVSLSEGSSDEVDHVNGVRVHRLAVENLYHPFHEPRHAAQRAVWHLRDTYNVAMAAKIGRVLDQERPDWVSAHNLGGFSVATWLQVKRRNIGLSQMLHDYYAICPRTTMNRSGANCSSPCASCRIYGTPRKLFSRLPDVVIGVSRFVLERHLNLGYFPRARSGVVYNGRPAQAVEMAPSRRVGDPLVLGFIGRVEPVKGIETLLKAVMRLPAGRWRLRVAGRPRDPRFLSMLRERYPASEIEYLGYVKSDELYRSVDLVVIPSEWHEPMPGVVYEPLGFGVPVLAARVGGTPEILGDAGCGWLFEPGNVDDLERRLRCLLDGWPERELMAQRALQRRAFFTPQRQVDDFLAVIESRRAHTA